MNRTRALAVLPLALAVCGAVVAVDQVSKQIALSHFETTRNKGVAFGLGGDVSTAVIVAELVFLVVILVTLSMSTRSGLLIWLPAGLLVGGALGNLADRARDGAVIDFIDLPLWPSFNLADVAIVVGVILLFIGVARAETAKQPP